MKKGNVGFRNQSSIIRANGKRVKLPINIWSPTIIRIFSPFVAVLFTTIVAIASAIAPTEQGYFLSGHKMDEFGGIDASISKVSLEGKILWSKSYGNPSGGKSIFSDLTSGNPTLIYDECWGITEYKNCLLYTSPSPRDRG